MTADADWPLSAVRPAVGRPPQRDVSEVNDEYETPAPGEWVTPVKSGYLMKCCDCGLVHRLDFRVIKPTKRKGHATIQNARHIVQFRAFRHEAN